MLREKELILLENLKKENARKTEEIQQLRNNQLIGQASGEESITITDGAFAFANILEETEIEVEGAKRKAYVVKLPQGLSKQKVRQGYNKFNIQKWAENNLEVNNGSNLSINSTEISWTTTTTDSFTKTFVSSDNTANKVQVVENFGLEVTGNESKTICWENPNKIECRALVSFLDENYNFISLLELGVSTEEKIIKNFTIPENSKYLTYRFGAIKADINVIYRKIMILDGTYTAETLPEYEEYGTSPSIKYPSEIENVKAWNLIDIEQIAQQTENVVTTFDKKNGWLTIENPNSNMAYVNILVPIEHIIIGKTYSLKVEFKSEEGCNVYLQKSAEDYSNFTQGIDDIIKNTAIDTYMKVLITPIANQTVTVRLSLAEEQEKIENKTYAPYGAISIGLGNSNINDEIYELGGFTNDTGENVNQSDRFRIKNYIDIEKFQSVTIKFNVKSMINAVGRYGLFDKNKIQIENAQITSTNYTINTKNAKYLRFWFLNNPSENFDMNTAKILVSSESSDYVTHQEQNYNLHIGDLELNGIGDVRDSLVIELEGENSSDKKIKKLYKREFFEPEKSFTGNEGWVLQNNIQQKTNRFIFSKFVDNAGISISDIVAIISNKFKNYSANQLWTKDIEGIAQSHSQIIINVDTERALDLSTFKQLLQQENVRYVCRKDEELIDLTDDYTELVKDLEYLINNFKTFKEVTHVEVDNGYIDLEYVKSTELALKNIQQQIDNISVLMLEGGTGNA